MKLSDLCSNVQIQICVVNYASRKINKDYPPPHPSDSSLILLLQSSYYPMHSSLKGFTGVVSSGLHWAETAGLKHDTVSETCGIPVVCIQSSWMRQSYCYNNNRIYYALQAGVNSIPHTLLTRSDSLFRGVKQCIAVWKDKHSKKYITFTSTYVFYFPVNSYLSKSNIRSFFSPDCSAKAWHY